jgi:DNA-binding MarR family transcriptional regulator
MTNTSIITSRQLEILSEIHIMGPVRLTDLAYNINASYATARYHIKRLSNLGLIDSTQLTYYTTRGYAWFITDKGEECLALSCLMGGGGLF